MGSWNQTCGLSNLHIHGNEPVVVFVIEETGANPNYCYTTPLFKPILMPFYSRYNDYGAGQDSSGIALPLILDGIKCHLVELPQGENTVHDIPVIKEAFNEALFWQAMLEDRLSVTQWPGSETRVNAVMIHKKIFDQVLANYTQTRHFYDTAGVFQTVHYGFDDILADLPTLVDTLLARGLAGRDLIMVTDSFYRLTWGLSELVASDNKKELNLAAKWLQLADEGRFSHIVRPIEVVHDLLESKDRVGLLEFMTEVLKALYIDHFMMETRKIWTPQGGVGSQRNDPAPYRTLMAAMEKVLVEAEDEFD